jgi:hypothetical protein
MAYVAVPAQQSLYQQSPFFHCRALLHKSDLEQGKKQFTADEKDIYIYIFFCPSPPRARHVHFEISPSSAVRAAKNKSVQLILLAAAVHSQLITRS